MKKSKLFTIIFRIFGVLILMMGFRMMGEGVYNYIEEHNQKDWIAATADVIDISSEYSGNRRHAGVNYDITYQYEVDGNSYSDKLYNRSRAMGIGDKIKIKYNPDAPEKSTDILVPSIKNLIIFLVFGAIFFTIGFFLSGIWALICKIHQRGTLQKEEVLPPEEYAEPEEVNRNIRNPVLAIILKIIVIAVVLGVVFLSVKLFPLR